MSALYEATILGASVVAGSTLARAIYARIVDRLVTFQFKLDKPVTIEASTNAREIDAAQEERAMTQPRPATVETG